MSRSQATTNTARGMMTAALTLITMFIAPACTRDPAASADTAARSSGAADARADQASEECAAADTQAEMTQCWSNVAAAAERRADESFRKLADWLSQRQQLDVLKMFEATQAQWEDYRQSHCEAVAGVYDGGSIAGMQEARCRARFDEERRRELDLVVSDANQ